MKPIFMTDQCICRMYSPSTSESELQGDASQKVSTSESLCDRAFNRLLLEAVDEGLSSLGDSSKQIIYLYLERTFSIEKQDIPSKIEEFINAIENIFEYGAKILEIEIIKHLYKEVGHDFTYFPEKAGLSFIEYVEAASHYFARKSMATKDVLGG